MITHCCARMPANTLNVPVYVATTLNAASSDVKMLFCISPVRYHQGSIFEYSMLIAVFYLCLSLIGWVWTRWRIEGNGGFHLILLCVTTFVGAVICFTLLVGQIFLWLFRNAIQQKVQVFVDGEEEIKNGAASGFFGCLLFSFLAAIIGWAINNYLENGISKHHVSYFLLLIYASPGLVGSIVSALLAFFIMITHIMVNILISTVNG